MLDRNHPQQESTCESWILQDWVDLKLALADKRSTETALNQTQQQLHSTNSELAQTQQQLHSSNSELARTRQQLHSTNSELAQTQEKLEQAQEKLQEKLEQAQKQLQIAQMQTEQFKLLVVAMETSKFWKLRKWWFDLKQKNQYRSSRYSIPKLPIISKQTAYNRTGCDNRCRERSSD